MSYWEKRQSSTLEEILKNADVSSDEIANLYAKSSIYLNDKIQGVFNKYRSKYGLSIQEAENLLNQLDDPTSYDEMLKKLKNSKGEEKQELLKQLESPAYRYRINRLQEVQESMDDVMQNIYNLEKKISTDSYVKTAHDAYYKTMFNIQKGTGAEFDFSSLNPKHINMLLHANWSGENYSKRIWNNTQDLSSQIKEELLMGILTGKTEKEMQKSITERFQVANYKARRLVQTESAYMSTMMDMEAYKEADVDTMKFVAMHDLKTSKICQQHDGKYVKIKDAVVGSNVPPLHPNCRSFITPVIDEELDKNMKRRVKDENGHYQMANAKETYEQWYERCVDNEAGRNKRNESDKLQNEDNEWLPFKFKSVSLSKVNNNEEIISKMIDKIDLDYHSDDFTDKIKNELKIIPQKDFMDLTKNKIKIIESFEGTYYDREEKNIFIQSDNFKEGTLAHELAHMAVDTNNLYENDFIKNLLQDVVNNSVIKVRKYDEKYYISFDCEKMIRPYQGRTYIDVTDDVLKLKEDEKLKISRKNLSYKNLDEYISVAYETFVINPQLLYNKDIELYNFFKNGGLTNGKQKK